MAKGDHIRVYRFGYWHHGVDVGGGRVIHFAGEPHRKLDARVCETTRRAFANGGRIEVVRRAGKAEAAAIAARARKALGQGGYHLLHNNCEHFSTKITTRRARSRQAEAAVVRALVGATSDALDGGLGGILAGDPVGRAVRRAAASAAQASVEHGLRAAVRWITG